MKPLNQNKMEEDVYSSSRTMTAVEWLIQEHFGSIDNCTSDFRNKVYQANEMFKQQIKDAYQTSHISMMTAEQYYNETFKQEQNEN